MNEDRDGSDVIDQRSSNESALRCPGAIVQRDPTGDANREQRCTREPPDDECLSVRLIGTEHDLDCHRGNGKQGKPRCRF